MPTSTLVRLSARNIPDFAEPSSVATQPYWFPTKVLKYLFSRIFFVVWLVTLQCYVWPRYKITTEVLSIRWRLRWRQYSGTILPRQEVHSVKYGPIWVDFIEIIPQEFFFSRLAWANWEKWSNCSEECGEGIHTRTRPCLLGIEGISCSGDSDESRVCKIKSCEGEYTKYSRERNNDIYSHVEQYRSRLLNLMPFFYVSQRTQMEQIMLAW